MSSLYTNRAFLRTISGSTASGFATWGFVFLLGLTVVDGDLSAGKLSAIQLGITLMARTLGFLIGVLFGGILSDKLSCRGVILVASLISALGIVAVMVGLNSTILLVYFGAIFAGIGQGGCRPAYQAFIPEVVQEKDLQPANAMMGLTIWGVTLLGPSITSAVVLFWGAMPAYALLLVMWLFSAFVPPNVEVRKKENVPTTMATVKTDLFGGLTEARKHPWFMGSLAALTLVIAFGYSATNVILPMVSTVSGGIGLMTKSLTAYALGGLSGSILLSKFKPSPVGWIALLGLASYGFAPLSLLFADELAIVLLGYFCAGLGIEVFNVLWFTAIQREVPKSHLARVSSLDFLCSYGLAPLGLAVIAPLAESAGVNTVLIVCGIVTLFAPLFVMRVASSRDYSVKS